MSDFISGTSEHPRMGRSREVYRHPALVRATHWLNAAAFLLLIPSGMLIFWANPELYWGETGYFGEPAWLRVPIAPNMLGSMIGRTFHFFAAWILVLSGTVYCMWGAITRHFQRKMLPTREQLSLRHLLREVIQHALFRRATGEAALHYNALQKIAYVVVVFIFIPLMVLSGLTMSPGFTAAVPELFWLWGRQTARSVHFITACGLVLFLLVHVFEVFVAGVRNEIRSMVTGRYIVPWE